MFGLWLLLLGRALPGIVGGITIAVALLAIGAAAGLVELAMVIWYRRLEPIVTDRWYGRSILAAPVESGRAPSAHVESPATTHPEGEIGGPVETSTGTGSGVDLGEGGPGRSHALDRSRKAAVDR